MEEGKQRLPRTTASKLQFKWIFHGVDSTSKTVSPFLCVAQLKRTSNNPPTSPSAEMLKPQWLRDRRFVGCKLNKSGRKNVAKLCSSVNRGRSWEAGWNTLDVSDKLIYSHKRRRTKIERNGYKARQAAQVLVRV